MTDLEKLHRAIAEGLKEVGINAFYTYHITEDRRLARFLVITHNECRYQLRLSMTKGNCELKRTTKFPITYHGPALADPEFFEKIRDLVQLANQNRHKTPSPPPGPT